MSKGIHIFYKQIENKDEQLKYVYSGGDFSDAESLVRAYDGILVINKKALRKNSIMDTEYGVDWYMEKACAAGENSHNIKLSVNGKKCVDLFASKVFYKVFSIYKKDGVIDDINAIIY